MRKIVCYCGLALAIFQSCHPPVSTTETATQAHPDNSQTSLDWDGVYRGTLPCADCQGIETTIWLNRDLGYRVTIKYLGKSDSAFESSGKFKWNDEGSIITLEGGSNGFGPASYLVGENTLTQLDMNGNRITGEHAANYILSKSNYAILEKYWKLVELNGKPVTIDSTLGREPHIILKEQDHRVVGNGGCNVLSGSYELSSLNRISFSKMITTQMACRNMETESQFLKVLQMADNFNVVGDMLTLNKARMAPLARFKAVYMSH